MLPVVINGTTYQIPQQGDSPTWGNQLSNFLQALANVANTSAGPGSILSSSCPINNNVTSATVITGLSFDPAVVSTAKIDYGVKRTTSTQSLIERGTIFVTYDPLATTWSYSLESDGDAGLTLDIASGQFTYKSSNMSGANYSGTFTFQAIATS